MNRLTLSRDAGIGLAAVGLMTWMSACDLGPAARSADTPPPPAADSAATYQADVEEGLGAAVAILIDTSGSMRDKAPGDTRPKYVVAQEALEAMLDATDAFVAKRPDFPIKIGIYRFSSSVRMLRRSSPTIARRFGTRWRACRARRRHGDRRGAARGAAGPVSRRRVPEVPAGRHRRRQHERAPPDEVAREIFRKSEGAVQVYFVAFDTSPEKFAFLKDVGGDVIGAGTGAELRQALDGIYQGKILAEAPDAGEREPVKP